VALRLERAGTPPAHLFASGRRAPSRYREEHVHLGDDNAIIAELIRLSGTESSILGDEELLRMVLPAIRNDYRAAETYRPAADAPAAGHPDHRAHRRRRPRTSLDDARGWREHTRRVRTADVSGGHFLSVENSAEVVDALSSRLRAEVRPDVRSMGLPARAVRKVSMRARVG